MEVRIRLQKAGRSSKKRYNYRIVAMSRQQSRQSKALDILGHYDSAQNPAQFSINEAKLDKWVKRGANLSDTVRTLVKRMRKSS